MVEATAHEAAEPPAVSSEVQAAPVAPQEVASEAADEVKYAKAS